MKQSDIYAHFMAKKLSVDENKPNEENGEGQPEEGAIVDGDDPEAPTPKNYKKVEIDEEAAYQSI